MINEQLKREGGIHAGPRIPIYIGWIYFKYKKNNKEQLDLKFWLHIISGFVFFGTFFGTFFSVFIFKPLWRILVVYFKHGVF